jgi:hypothetical protein
VSETWRRPRRLIGTRRIRARTSPPVGALRVAGYPGTGPTLRTEDGMAVAAAEVGTGPRGVVLIHEYGQRQAYGSAAGRSPNPREARL